MEKYLEIAYNRYIENKERREVEHMLKYYVDKDTGYKYKFLQDELVKAYKDAYVKMNEETEITKKDFNELLGKRVLLGVETIRKHMSKAKTPKCIADICKYGEALANDERAFLILSEVEEAFSAEIKEVLEYKDFPLNCVRATKSNLIRIFEEYAASDGFCKVQTEKEVLIYYRRKIDMVEAMVYQMFDRPKLTKVLLDIIMDLRKFICASEIPGLPKTWLEINPNLRFYAAGFEILEQNPKLYDEFKQGKQKWKLDYFPEFDEVEKKQRYFEERDQYFIKKYNESKEKNFHYNEVDFYQEELLKAINDYFETAVKEVLNSGM